MSLETIISDESNGTLALIEEKRTGQLVYNRAHSKNNFVLLTANINIINQRIRDGWIHNPGMHKYILRAPEAVLCDLSEIQVNPTEDPVEIMTMHKILQNEDLNKLYTEVLKEKYFADLEVVNLEGKSTCIEVRIAGSDKRIYELPKFVYNHLKKLSKWNKIYNETSKIIKNRPINIFRKNIKESSAITKKFYNDVLAAYKEVGQTGIPDEIIYGPWESMPQADIYIFPPKSALKYAYGFIEQKNESENIMLWEYHSGFSFSKESVLFEKGLYGKKVVVADRSYSGNTLDYIQTKIIEKGGKPINVSLFPKSKKAVANSDFTLFIDQLIPIDEFRLCHEWGEKMFIYVINKFGGK